MGVPPTYSSLGDFLIWCTTVSLTYFHSMIRCSLKEVDVSIEMYTIHAEGDLFSGYSFFVHNVCSLFDLQ